MKIVFIGSNPSCTSPVNDPFAHCMSANRMINDWIPKLGLTRDQVEFMNVANYKTPKNRPLKTKEIDAELPRLTVALVGRKVVTLGKTAEIAIDRMCRENFLNGNGPEVEPTLVLNLPHPSGRNRLLNDRAKVEQMLSEVKQALESQ